MGILEEELEALTKELAEAEKAESEPEKAVVEEPEEDPEVTDTEEDGDDEAEPANKPEVKAEEKPVEKTEELDASGYARLRRELAAERKARMELEARVAAPAVVAPTVTTQQNQEPDVNKDPVAWIKWQKEELAKEVNEIKSWKETVTRQNEGVQLETAAIQEFKAIEADFKAQVPDFDNVADHLNAKFAESIAILEPHLNQEQVMAKVKDRVLRMAGEYVRQGLNPVEELYHLSKERYGYTAPVQEDDAPKKADKPDLNKVAANRKRNAGTAGAKGSGSMPQLTREVAADMPVHEWAALSPDEKRRLLSAE